MASITFTVPDASLPAIRDAFTRQYGYRATLPDGTPNPQSADQFAQAKVVEYVKNVVRADIAQQHQEAARQQAQIVAQQQVDAITVSVTVQ